MSLNSPAATVDPTCFTVSHLDYLYIHPPLQILNPPHPITTCTSCGFPSSTIGTWLPGSRFPSSRTWRTPPDQVQGLESGEHLSQREREVLRLMAQGASNQAIAEQLVITVGTVKSHINHILMKLEASNRTEAVARARQLGLLEI